MFRSVFALLTVVLFSGGLFACSKKEASEPPTPPVTRMMPGQGIAPMPPHENITMPPSESMKTVVPEAVRGKWKAVTLTVVDRETSNVKDYTATLGGKLTIPNTNIVIQVVDFLPDFKIEGTVFTSASAEPLNPAARVQITEGGQEIFKGWLFQKFPSMHPFEHQRISITLKSGVSA